MFFSSKRDSNDFCDFKSFEDLGTYLDSIKKTKFYEKITTENRILIEEIDKIINDSEIIEKIQNILKLRQVKRSFILNLIGEKINEITNINNSLIGDSVLEFPRSFRIFDENKNSYLITQTNSKYDSSKSVEKTLSNDSSLLTKSSDKITQSEEEFFNYQNEMLNELKKNLNSLDLKDNFKEFFTSLEEEILNDYDNHKKIIFTASVYLLRIAAAVLEFYLSNISNEISSSNSESNAIFKSENKDSSEKIVNLRSISTNVTSQLVSNFKPEKSIEELQCEKKELKKSVFSEKIAFSGRSSTNVPEFETNIISIRINDIFNSKAEKELNFDKRYICKKCHVLFYINDCDLKDKNFLICKFCSYDNHELSNSFNNFDLSLFKALDTDLEIKKNIQKTTNICTSDLSQSQQTKIFILCIDISGSMSGSRIDIVKKACLSALDELYTTKPDYKLALITFESHSLYYGDGSLIESITKTLQDLDDFKVKEEFRNKFNNLRPIRESYKDLKKKINDINSGGGTKIIKALVQSVLLASTGINSEILLCTDGEADDRSLDSYQKIANFCTTDSSCIKINIITFPDSCELITLGVLANVTGGNLEKLSNSDEFKLKFQDIVKNFNATLKIDSVELTIIAHDDVQIEGANNNFKKINTRSNEEEILVKFSPKDFESNEFFFQFQIETSDSIRVIRKKFSKDINPNEKLIFAYSIRKLSKLACENMSEAKEFSKKFSNYIHKSTYDSENALNIIEEVDKHDVKIGKIEDNLAKFFYNNQKITSGSLDLVQKRIITLRNDLLDKFQNDLGFVKFKEKIEKKFQVLNLNNFRVEQKINVFKILVTFKIIEKALNLINFDSNNLKGMIQDDENEISFENVFSISKEKMDCIFSLNLDKFENYMNNENVKETNIFEQSYYSNLINNFIGSFNGFCIGESKYLEILKIKLLEFSIEFGKYETSKFNNSSTTKKEEVSVNSTIVLLPTKKKC
ncbi:unnamed protein product [Brachionus calyciflorus]|uniref:VWFA domain-containing protein n=1 Tax=Brachionus calyciflorus TaxID=104777 RepID=A0A813R810_9BILA|nr:unnamed protein product [Brachionus calyciflorus]